jgi:hypothetical protein
MARGFEERDRDWGEGELDLALRSENCPACVLVRETEDAILTWLAKVNMAQPETVRNLVSTRGLCAAHWAGLLARLGERPGVATSRALLEIATAVDSDLDRGTPIAPGCTVCDSMERRAGSVVGMVLGRLDRPEGRAAFERSFGLCQPHMIRALALVGKADGRAMLLRIHRTQLRRVADRMAAASHDGRGAHEVRGAAVKLAGSSLMPAPRGGPRITDDRTR